MRERERKMKFVECIADVLLCCVCTCWPRCVCVCVCVCVCERERECARERERMCVCAFACERKGSASAVSSAFIGHLHLCVREIEKERVCV